jgi:hypothetical protein
VAIATAVAVLRPEGVEAAEAEAKEAERARLEAAFSEAA